MLINLVLTVCLASAPEQCHEETLIFESQGDLMKCMFLAPAEIARWSGDHPAVNVVWWKCKLPGSEQSL